MIDFPTMVYRTPGPHAAPRGTYAYKGVADQAEYDAALASGWFASVADAMGGKPVNITKPLGRDELEAKAKALGVSFNWKTSDEVLAARIAEAA